MKTLGTDVLCSECGKKLRGVVGVTPGFHVRKHMKPDRTPCRGHLFTNHKAKAAERKPERTNCPRCSWPWDAEHGQSACFNCGWPEQ